MCGMAMRFSVSLAALSVLVLYHEIAAASEGNHTGNLKKPSGRPRGCSLLGSKFPCHWTTKRNSSRPSQIVYPLENTATFRYRAFSFWSPHTMYVSIGKKKVANFYRRLAIFVHTLPDQRKVIEEQTPTTSPPTGASKKKQKLGARGQNVDKSDSKSVEAEKSRKGNTSTASAPAVVLKVSSPKFQSPPFYIEKEGCVKFNLKGYSGSTTSDSLMLWGVSDKGAKLLWAIFGSPSSSWSEHIVGLSSEAASLFFNSSSFITVRKNDTKYVMTYQLDYIRIFIHPCGGVVRLKHTDNEQKGRFAVGKTPFSNINCQWIAVKFSKPPTVEISIENVTVVENFSAVTTHVTQNGFNVCIKKIHGHGLIGWNRDFLYVNWVAYLVKKNSTKLAIDPTLKRLMPNLIASNKKSSSSSTVSKKTSVDALNLSQMIENASVLFAPSIGTCDNQFKCTSSACVPLDCVCDGKNDCPSGDDEGNCNDRVALTFLICIGTTALLFVILSTIYYAHVEKSSPQPSLADQSGLLPNRYTVLVENDSEDYDSILADTTTAAHNKLI